MSCASFSHDVTLGVEKGDVYAEYSSRRCFSRSSGFVSGVDRHLMPRPLLRTAVLLPPASAALGLAFAAAHVRPPAGDVARLCIAMAVGLLLVNLFAWAARDGARFG